LAIALLLPLAWLLGTFPSAGLVARARGVDVSAEGSGNPGASNVARLLGWKYGALVLLADFAKGALATAVGLAIDGRPGAYVLGAAAVLGHTFPLYR
jgi:glycerol-3-phosphate acyltransferase PlsY